MTSVPEVRDRVSRHLSHQYGDPRARPDGTMMVEIVGVPVEIRVEADRDVVSVVVSAVVRSAVQESTTLLRYVATQNYRLGSLRLTEEPAGRYTVMLFHSLLGDTLDPDELRHAVEAVASTTRDIRGDLERSVGTEDGSVAPSVQGPVIGPYPPPVTPAGIAWFRGSIAVARPPGWFAKESFTVLAPDGQANVILSSEPLDSSIDVIRYAEVQRGLLETEFPEYHEMGSGDMLLSGGIPAQWRQFGWSPPNGNRVTQFQLYAVPVPGRGYTATATSPDARWAQYVELLRFILCNATVFAEPVPGSR